MTSKRPDLIVHSDETILAVMRADSWKAACDVASERGVSKSVAMRWRYRTVRRALLLADEYDIPYRARKPERAAMRSSRASDYDLIKAVMAGDA